MIFNFCPDPNSSLPIPDQYRAYEEAKLAAQFEQSIILFAVIIILVALGLLSYWIYGYKCAVSGKRKGAAASSRKVEQGSNLGELDAATIHPRGGGFPSLNVSHSPKRPRTIDVVIPTLKRPSFIECVHAVCVTFDGARIIPLFDRGVPLGRIRNLGLKRCESEFVAFVDDDILVNAGWRDRCFAELGADPSLVVVQGVVPEGETLGCMIVRREPFMLGGGFPDCDSYVNERFSESRRVLGDAVCYHYSGGFRFVVHTARWIASFYQTEQRAGLYHNPAVVFPSLLRCLRLGKPELFVGELLFLVKTFFALPFIVMDRRKKNEVV